MGPAPHKEVTIMRKIIDESGTRALRQDAKDQARHYLEIARTHRNYKGYYAVMLRVHEALELARTATSYTYFR